jgi:predicted GIY-YIG superfamily endonuclease
MLAARRYHAQTVEVRKMVYILEIDPPYRHCKYYVGYTSRRNLDVRIAEHGTSKGARLLLACRLAGHGFHLVAYLSPGRKCDERKIKSRKSTPRFVAQIKRNPDGWTIV